MIFFIMHIVIYHNILTNIIIIMKDLIKLMDPKYIEVTGFFNPRGGICIYPFANYADEQHQALREARLMQRMSEMASNK